MISASSLMRHCGHPRALSKVPPRDAAERKREANKQTSAELGSTFHAAVDAWCKTGVLPVLENLELQGWMDGMATMFQPKEGVETELAWGLTLDGVYCPVDEPEPHVYVPSRQFFGQEPLPPLLTAGRADLIWEDGDLVWCVDVKTGRFPVTPATRNLQVNSAGMALASRVGASGYIPAVFYSRDSYFDWGDRVILGTSEHRAMFDEVREAALMDEQPRVGDWCGQCWERKRCPAYKEGQP